MPRTKATEPGESTPADRPSSPFPVGARVHVRDARASGPIDCDATVEEVLPLGPLRVRLDDDRRLIAVPASSLSGPCDGPPHVGGPVPPRVKVRRRALPVGPRKRPGRRPG
jgi:hypothetical protein